MLSRVLGRAGTGQGSGMRAQILLLSWSAGRMFCVHICAYICVHVCVYTCTRVHSQCDGPAAPQNTHQDAGV